MVDVQYLDGNGEREAMRRFQEAAGAASNATCERHRYGSVIVSGVK
jgi:hypothetical protein